jgi:Tol biopolymer transport system component
MKVRRAALVVTTALVCALAAYLAHAGVSQAGSGRPGARANAGGRIAYLSSRDGQSGLFVMNADGSGQRRLTTGADLFHAWSPDGCRIVFRRQLAQIMTVATDGAPPALGVQTSGGDPAGDMRAYLSPDSVRVVFTGRMPGGTGKDIFVVRADGSGLTNLTRADGLSREYYDARWSPDGTRILFTSNGVQGTSVMNADGSGRRLLAERNNLAFWSADGSKVLVMTPEGLRALDVGGPAMPESRARDESMVRIAWSLSPDGSKLAFVAATKDDAMSIGVMNSDWTGERTVAQLDREDISIYMAGPSAMPPEWSPDASRIAFSHRSLRQVRGPNGEPAVVPGVDIFSVGSDGSGLTQLTHDGQSAAPAWSRASTCA